MQMEQTEYSETSAYKIQTPGNHLKESIQQFIDLQHLQFVEEIKTHFMFRNFFFSKIVAYFG